MSTFYWFKVSVAAIINHPKTKWLKTIITFSLFFTVDSPQPDSSFCGSLRWLQSAHSWCWNYFQYFLTHKSSESTVDAGCGLRPHLGLSPITHIHGLSAWLLHVCSASSWHGTCMPKASTWEIHAEAILLFMTLHQESHSITLAIVTDPPRFKGSEHYHFLIEGV